MMDALLLLKASVLLAAALAAAAVMRRAPAVSRHRLWTVAFAAVLALPALAVALPVLHVPVPSCCDAPAASPAIVTALAPSGGTIPPQDHGSGIVVTDSGPSQTAGPEPWTVRGWLRASFPSFPSAWRPVLLTVWLAGTLAAVSTLLLSLVRVRRLSRAAEQIDDAGWSSSANALGGRLGLRRPARLLMSASVGTPMAGGVWRPAIFLPASAREWSPERRDLVLAHEIAHLAGHDPLRHVAARLAVALYWFHPLAWMAAREAAAAREQACDEAVLALGTRPSAYARVLLDLAESLQPSAAGVGALPMVQRAHLETRLMAILNEDVRTGPRRRLLIPVAGLALGTLLLAAAQPSVRASAAAAAVTITAPSAVLPVSRAPAPAPVPASQADAGAGSACGRDLPRSRSFFGTTSNRTIGGRDVILEQVGTSGTDRIIQKTFEDLRVCMVAEDAGAWSSSERPSQWLGRARRVVLESRRGNNVKRLEVAPYGTGQKVSWQVGGADRTFDAAAEQWRDRMLEILDTTWEVSNLRGEVSSLMGEISSIRGDESSLRGDISSLMGDVSSMRGNQSSIRGDESSLRGDISSIRGHLSSLQGSISSERGSISSLQSGGYRLDDSARIRDAVARHENEIARIEREIRDYNADGKVVAVERQIAALDADRKVAAIEAEIRKFDLDGKVAAIEKKIAALDVDGKITTLEKKIASLDADRRVRQLEERRDEELKRLAAAIAAIR